VIKNKDAKITTYFALKFQNTKTMKL
jgi:hypothetical protein